MLENIVAWVLNNYIGEYLEDLNTDQLSVAFLSGQVELENVPLKTSALRKLDLPLEIKSGLLGKLTLSVPLTRVRSEPWTLKLSDVLIVVGPPPASRRYDVEAVEQVEQQKKESMLSELEQRHKNDLLALMNIKNSISQNSWWGASLLSTVLSNIQLILNNVHIRYEDETTLPGGLAFNCGIRIQKMTMQTTDSSWKPGFVEPQEFVNTFKKLDLQGFSLYWNSDVNIPTTGYTPQMLRTILAPEDHSYTYIIQPFSTELRMERNASKFPLKGSNPRFKFFLRPSSITCELTRRQMSELRALNREWARFERARQHRKWRPQSAITGNVRPWWLFAFNRIAEESRRTSSRRTLHFAFTRARHLNAYCRAYRRRLISLIRNPIAGEEAADQNASKANNESNDDCTIMKQIERDAQYSYNELHLYRETVFRKLLREKESELAIEPNSEETFENIDSQMEDIPVEVPTGPDTVIPESQGVYGWITSFFAAEEKKIVAKDEAFDFSHLDFSDLKKLPNSFAFKDMEEEILDVLHESWDDSTLLRRDSLLADISLRLDHLTLRFIDSSDVGGVEQRRILALDLMGVTSKVDLSPRQHSLSVHLCVQDMSVQRLRSGCVPASRDESSYDDSLMYSMAESTKILLAVGRESNLTDDKEPIFRMIYRRKSPRMVVRHTIEGQFRPISVMYEENALEGLSTVFADDPLMFKSIVATVQTQEITPLSHLFINLFMPSVTVELRRHGWGSSFESLEWSEGEPFTCLILRDMSFGLSKKEEHVSQMKIGIGHLEFSDLFEKTTYPLFSTGSDVFGLSQTWSNSCPDVSSVVPQNQVPSSLPNGGFLADMLSSLPIVHTSGNQTRKTSMIDKKSRKELLISINLVDSKHPEFEAKYKKNCTIEMDMNDVDMGMNRRTWTALMDVAGILGKEEANDNLRTDDEKDIEIVVPLEAFTVVCTIRMQSLKIGMHYPANMSKLGMIVLESVEIVSTIKLNGDAESMTAALSMAGLKIDDRTPLFSEMYPERIRLVNESGIVPPRAEIHIVKYLGDDPKRDCDLSVKMVIPETMHLYYVHTHRFFCGLLDYWMHFFELQDQIAKSKRCSIQCVGRASRVKLDIDMKCPTTIVLPLNQTSEQVLVMEATGVCVSNQFVPMSQAHNLFKSYSIDTDYGYDISVDCLLDNAKVVLLNLRVHEGLRVIPKYKKNDKNEFFVGRGIFESVEFVCSLENVFSRKFDLTADVFRNLDGVLSRNAPDIAVIIGVNDFIVRATTDFYILLRGVLEKNFGDPIIPIPETIPLEVLQKPIQSCEVSSMQKYATLSFRLTFDNIELNCQVPDRCTTQQQSASFDKCYTPFALVKLTKAKMLFDVFIDSQSELDLICESTELRDTRIEQLGNHNANAFTTILQYRDVEPGKPRLSLMSEAHIMMKKDEPPVVTLVLMNARVLILPDWLNDAKDFVLLSTDFVPKYSDEPPKNEFECEGGVLDRRLSAMHHRKKRHCSGSQTFNVKITLRESDLLFLENPSERNSFALAVSTTAVLNMNDSGGFLCGNLEIQSMTLGWCSMRGDQISTNLCSNEFSVGIGLSVDLTTKKSTGEPGLPQLTIPRHRIDVEFHGMIGRLSYKDAKVLILVIDGFMKYFNKTFGKTLIPVIGLKPAPKALDISRIYVKTDHADLWILDDYQGSSIPLLRLSLSNLVLDHQPDRIVTSFSISCDYFNQRFFGWEPLMENWKILRLLYQSKEKLQSIELITESRSSLDVNITEQLIQQAIQFTSRWPHIRSSFDQNDFRNVGTRSRYDHLPYSMKNETGCELTFTTDVLTARVSQRKSLARWNTVGKDKDFTFEFPTKLLLYSQTEREPPRLLIVRVVGWDEISPVNVDACGTYFRVVKANKVGIANARLVIRVTMEKDGRKVVTVRSSMEIRNSLPHSITVFAEQSLKEIMCLEPSCSLPVPLIYAHSQFTVLPVGAGILQERGEISWRHVRSTGEVLNRTQKLETNVKGISYWLCSAVRREYYPEDESLPGHTVDIVAPLQVQNLLPIDVEIRMQDQVFAVGAGRKVFITSVDITREIQMALVTDRLTTHSTCSISKSSIGETPLLLSMKLLDGRGRPLDVYAHASIDVAGSIRLVLWVPYWIINKTGIPLVLKQKASQMETAGQGEEHERAKDRHPVMFSFADDDCPKQCSVRIGSRFSTDSTYQPRFSKGFSLIPGAQSLKLVLTHDSLPTLFYNIGIEVRAGTGLYKDTQVVLLCSRYVLNNQSSYNLSVCHQKLIDRPSEHVYVSSHSCLVWNEKVEDEKMVCVRRSDVRYWSCPFRIDRIGSFHVTMRDADETPRFVRTEIILSGAAFHVTFTDAEYYPPPIRIENKSDVPVLYQQYSESTAGHLRTICKARSHVDYAWDDQYGSKAIVLQVYENKSHVYDPSIQKIGDPLVYENNMFIQLSASFQNVVNVKRTEECELVLETLQKGKVILNKQNRIDGSGNQLWRFCKDGYIENIGLTARSKERMVLDVLEKAGNQLMMTAFAQSRKKYQKWVLMPDGRMCLQALPSLFVTARNSEVSLNEHERNATLNEDGVSLNQMWKVQRQRAGSGTLDVQCMHNGPTLVVEITDREQKNRTMSLPMVSRIPTGIFEISVTMRSGFGLSFVNGLHEELMYIRFGGIVMHAKIASGGYQITASVDVIQADNQLAGSSNMPLLFCEAEQQNEDHMPQVPISELPAGVPATARPALKLELSCIPHKHYDAFECFRLRLCDMYVQLNELLLWKLVQFAQASDAAASVQEQALCLPPNVDLDRPDPLRTRRWYFGTLDLEMGQIDLSVVTVPKSGLPWDCRQLKHQFNLKLVSFENATVSLPPFRQYHYFETSTLLLETLKKFYLAELKNQTLSIIVTLDAFGNPQGLITDLKDAVQGLFIEGDLQRFVAGLGYGVSNSISKMASSAASGVGALTFDQAHEARRRHNMIRSQSTSSTPLTHLYSGVKGLGVGFFGGMTAILTNTINESKRSGIVTGTFRGITTGAVDTLTKPVQGIFDFVGGTASAMKELAGQTAGSSSRKAASTSRVRPPRVCRDLFHLLPPYSLQLANAQLEMQRINGFSTKERLLDLEVCLEQFTNNDLVRQYVLISSKQCYVCRQVNDDPSNVIQRVLYKFLMSANPRTELTNNLACIEVTVDTDKNKKNSSQMHIWCSRLEVARRLADKIMRAKAEYDHSKRTLKDVIVGTV